MDENGLVSVLNKHYNLRISELTLLREGGNATYSATSNNKKYFLKSVGPAFSDTINMSIDINLYLQKCGFPVPQIVIAADGLSPYVIYGENYLILYEFLDTEEINMERDAEEVGSLIGQLHNLMEKYQGSLVMRDRKFYIERYINILKMKQYPGVDEFIDYGNELWKRVERLPFGYAHGDLYCGNIERAKDGKLYILDFDTSCCGFQLYDLALICNQTDYFVYKSDGMQKTINIYNRVLPEYMKYHHIEKCGTDSLCDMLAMYHFALQATIIEIYGPECVDNDFFDRQISWLKRWRK